ncbi:MAG: hypothetical protein LBR66_02140 [Candidatus Symbiothrix sp.]|nr:hypothetical protein [Candidatus Symbiothrix sp.]
MITYNHEPYIAQAIGGVMMQQTDVPIELVIGEDCSTVNADTFSKITDWTRRDAIFFGDGAGAAVVSAAVTD